MHQTAAPNCYYLTVEPLTMQAFRELKFDIQVMSACLCMLDTASTEAGCWMDCAAVADNNMSA